MRVQLGRTRKDFRLWQDKVAIAHGELWEGTIKKGISESVFFIPIITPTAVRSSYCKLEFESFLAREKELDRNNLIFPILYVRVPALDDERLWSRDPLLAIIGSRPYDDWQNLRHLDASSSEVVQRVERFCANICRALEQELARRVSEEERRRQEAEIKQRADEEERRRKAEAEERQRAEAERRRLEEESISESTQNHTFISFSTEDRKAATEILHELERAGVRFWIATRDVPYGRDYQEAIVDAVDQADSMVLVFSNAANNSQDVTREIALASEHKILILPVRIEDVRPTKALRYQLATRQYIDLYDDREQKMKSIIQALCKVRHIKSPNI